MKYIHINIITAALKNVYSYCLVDAMIHCDICPPFIQCHCHLLNKNQWEKKISETNYIDTFHVFINENTNAIINVSYRANICIVTIVATEQINYTVLGPIKDSAEFTSRFF